MQKRYICHTFFSFSLMLIANTFFFFSKIGCISAWLCNALPRTEGLRSNDIDRGVHIGFQELKRPTKII